MKRIFIIILTLSLFFFNSAQARTVCHYKVTTITAKTPIAANSEISVKEMAEKHRFKDHPQYLFFILITFRLSKLSLVI